jgi:hypothetical protein
LDKIKNISEWVKNIYNYNLWNIDNTVISKNNFSIVENWITNNPYDFYQWSGNNERSWQNVELIWEKFGSISTLSIINSFSSNKAVSKYTKISIQPELASFIEPHNNHIALWTKINYSINWNHVILPSDGIWVKWKNFEDSKKLFRWDISADNWDDYDDSELSPLVKNIKILWIVSSRRNEKNLLATDKKRNIWWDIKKWQVRNKVSRKVTEIMRWNDWDEWDCNIDSCNSFDYNWEKVIAVKWNVTISWDYEVEGKINLIVYGNIYINWNIYKKTKDSILAIVVLNPDWFVRKSFKLPTNLSDLSDIWKWFVFINPKITNVDAFMYVQWSLLSYDWKKIFNGWNTLDTDKDMFNQLYIRWWVISSNTIWGSRLPDTNDGKCPWFVADCNTNVAQAFDLVYLRRYYIVDASIYWGLTGNLVPYIPVSIASDINSYNNNKAYMWWKRYCKISNSRVDCKKDDDSKLQNVPDTWKEYPLYIEFDTAIKTNSPVVFTP